MVAKALLSDHQASETGQQEVEDRIAADAEEPKPTERAVE